MTFIQQLLKKGAIDKTQATALEYEIKTSESKEEEVILKNKIVTEDFLFGLKSENLKIPLKTVSAEDIKLKVLETIPEESAKYYRMIPLAMEDNRLEIGMVYPEDLKAREALEFLARQNKFTYKVFLITISNFNGLLKKYRNLKKEVTRALEELESELGDEDVEMKAEQVERVAEEAPISKVVAVILRHSVD
jgi:type II secretory ATPase GspE/PulE/Tfp pilus assembly ATPase PilB-like protein